VAMKPDKRSAIVRSPIVIVPYAPRWPGEFRQLGATLRRALGGLALRIDHIGSTAVPGLAAKDIIDIQVTVKRLVPAAPVADALVPVGYTIRPDIVRDHQPRGDSRAADEWAKLYFAPPAGQRPTHLHVRAEGRANQRYPLLFRDYLRSCAEATAAYAEVKRQLARRFADDIEAYYDLKDPVCDIIIAAAESWAREVGWNPGGSDA
jgi:GrpB-like predicted nucleotidyltransferase (UPF0157 family)